MAEIARPTNKSELADYLQRENPKATVYSRDQLTVVSCESSIFSPQGMQDRVTEILPSPNPRPSVGNITHLGRSYSVEVFEYPGAEKRYYIPYELTDEEYTPRVGYGLRIGGEPRGFIDVTLYEREDVAEEIPVYRVKRAIPDADPAGPGASTTIYVGHLDMPLEMQTDLARRVGILT